MSDADKYVTVAVALAVAGSMFSVAAVATTIAVATRITGRLQSRHAERRRRA